MLKGNMIYKDQRFQEDPELHQKLNQQEVRIRGKDWQNKNFNSYALEIWQWGGTTLYLYQNWHKPILKDIAHVKFVSLLHINLGYNNMDSIESLQRIQMPKLQHLALDGNKINVLKSIRKTRWKHLQNIQFHNNKLRDHERISQFWFPDLQEMTFNDPYRKLKRKNLKWEPLKSKVQFNYESVIFN